MRTKSGEKYPEMVAVKLSATEKQKLLAMATVSGRSVSELLRNLVQRAAYQGPDLALRPEAHNDNGQ